MPLRCLTGDLAGGDQVVDQLARGRPCSARGTCAAGWRWRCRCRSASAGPCRCRRRCRRTAPGRGRSSGSPTPCRPGSAAPTCESWISAVVVSKLSFGGLDERVRGVDDLAEARAGVLERGARLGDDRAQVGLRAPTRPGCRGWSAARSSTTGIAVFGGRDLRPVREVGPVVGLRLELDVLLTDRGLVADERMRVAGIFSLLFSMESTTSTPLSVSFMLATWPTVTPR